MKYKIEWMERKTTSTQKQMIKATLSLEGAQTEGVTIWADFPGFNELMPGGEVEGDIVAKGDFKTLYAPRPQTPSRGMSGGMAKLVEKKAEAISHAQDRKEDGIKLSATFRDAGLITASMIHAGLLRTEMDIKDAHRKWRDWLSHQYDDPTIA